jgi:glyceraldehyde 3-phosphate dehydrogenase
VVLYGFGRIGRLVARILIDKTDGGDSALRLRAVVVRKGKAPNDLLKRASLLRRDSVHGAFDGTIRVDEERQSFVANGNEVRVIYADSPDSIDYTAYGIDNAVIRRQHRGVA